MNPLSARLKRRLRHSPLMPLLRPRRFHAYCIGLPKTGTTSIGLILRSNYRSAHEPLPERTRNYVLQAHRGEISRAELENYLRWRDRELYLEMESSHPIAVFIATLVQLFPESRFVLTVRSPRPWLASLINQQLTGRAKRAMMAEPGWRARFFPALHDLCCGRVSFTPHDGPLERLSLYPIDGYLGWWREHNQTILESVPAHRLLVIRTERLSEDVSRLAAFLGIAPGTLDFERTHANRAERRHSILDDVDTRFLEDRIEHHCRDLLRAFDSMADTPAPEQHGGDAAATAGQRLA